MINYGRYFKLNAINHDIQGLARLEALIANHPDP